MKLAFRMFFVVLVVWLVFGCGSKTSGLEGKVVDGKGQPMSGIKVIAKQAQPMKGYEKFETTTGADGVFKFKGLFPESEYSIFPWSDKWKTSAKVTVQSGPGGQTIMLPSPMTVRFTLSSDGIIMDSQLGLQWAPATDQPMNWFKAKKYTQNLSLGGGGWRLPTRPELKSIYNKSMKGNADPAFHINDNWVWTSETRGKSAWLFNFAFGLDITYSRFTSYRFLRVLAVRSGK
ncbi:MAG: DUF1566 domain-containing protein [Pseudomonadota bacterium]|jgi:hypothetical protein|nr:DUF1566 domain-containing protein [Pseudomonadota bacterium]